MTTSLRLSVLDQSVAGAGWPQDEAIRNTLAQEFRLAAAAAQAE